MMTASFDGAKIIADELSEAQWEAIRRQCHHKETTPLASPITGDPVMCKRRRDTGTRFFACYPGGHDGFTEPETVHHIKLKKLIRAAAARMGFDCDIEHVHKTGTGDIDWIADTLITRPGHDPLTIEVQWSNQTDEKFADRTKRYRKDHVDCIWLDRHATTGQVGDYRTDDVHPVEGALRLPLRLMDDGGYKVWYSNDWHTVGDMVEGVLSGTVGTYRRGTEISVYVEPCWKCGRLIATWALPESEMFPDSGRPRVEEQYARNVSKYLEFLPIGGQRAFICTFADMSSKTYRGYYRAFVCPFCNGIQGDFYRFMENSPVATFALGRGNDKGELLFGELWSDGVPMWETRTSLFHDERGIPSGVAS